jgi:hypothetical protein
MISIFSSRVVHSFHSLRSLHSFTPLGQSLVSRRSLVALRSTRELRSVISRNDELNLCASRAQPSTPGTDITHKSALNITPSVKMEHDIVSNIGARNAGVCIFV